MQLLLQRKSNKYYIFYVCVSNLRYPACNARVLYCHLRPVQLYKIFAHYLTNGTTSEKKVVEHKMCVLIFSRTFSRTFFTLIRNERDVIINVFWTSFRLPRYYCQDFNETWIFSTDFQKVPKYQIPWISVQWELSCCTDRHDIGKSRFPQFSECTQLWYGSKKVYISLTFNCFWRNAMTCFLPENQTLSCATAFGFRRSPQPVCSVVTQ